MSAAQAEETFQRFMFGVCKEVNAQNLKCRIKT